MNIRKVIRCDMKLVVWTILLLSILTVLTAAGRTRAKRLVGFRKGSKFFLRMNFKENMLNSTNIFAHASGFKVSWDVPEGIAFSKKRSIRAVYDDVEFLFDRHGFDGRSCLLSHICQAKEYVSQRSGVVAKIIRLLLSYSNEDEGDGYDTSVLDPFNCDYYGASCPLDFTGIDTYLG